MFSGPPNSNSLPFSAEQTHDCITAPNSVTRYYLDIFVKGRTKNNFAQIPLNDY